MPVERAVGRDSEDRMPSRSHSPRRVKMNIPEKFMDGDDAHEDVTAPKTRRGHYMNQSFISMIANVGSTAGYNTRLGTGTSDNEGIFKDWSSSRPVKNSSNNESNTNAWESQSMILQRQTKQPASDSQMYGSVLSLSKRPMRKRHLALVEEQMSTSQILKPQSNAEIPHQHHSPSDHDKLGKVEGHDTESIASRTADGSSGSTPEVPDEGMPSTVDMGLEERLAHVFKFETRENLIAEYPCWLLQSVMLQGYLYITSKHICFYAYLPRRSNAVAKSGFLSKKGRQSPQYKRRWFVLKGDVLSYFSDPSSLYFPTGHIDLRSGVSAQLNRGKDSKTNDINFTITTAQRLHQFKADSSANAREWVKQIQKVIFRSRNESDSVKISLPINNILDIEDNPIMDFADTFKIRVVDNDETFAIDEYFFSFFGLGRDALQTLKSLVDNNGLSKNMTTQSTAVMSGATPSTMRENVNDLDFKRSTSSEHISTTQFPSRPSNASNLFQTRIDSPSLIEPADRLSQSQSDVSSETPERLLQEQLSTDESGSEESPSLHDLHQIPVTASQILQRDDVFQKPTIRRPRDPPQITSSSQPQQSSRQSSEKVSPRVDATTEMKSSSSSSTLQDLMRAGVYPLQKASGIAGVFGKQSKRVGNLLASGSKGYFEKVSSMWAGKKVHYGSGECIMPDEPIDDPEEDDRDINHGDRFREHFALPKDEKLQATYYGYLHRVVPVYGKLYLSNEKLCFRSLLPGSRTKMILPFKDIETVDKENGFRFGYSGLVLVVRGHEELFFEFSRPDSRDDCAITLLQKLEAIQHLQDSRIISRQEKLDMETAKAEHAMLERGRRDNPGEALTSMPVENEDSDSEYSPILFDDPLASIINFKPVEPLRITCLTIGSRGDVQPYIALCKGLMADGHKTLIATHAEFEPWIRHHGIDFAPVAGDPAEIMRLCVEHDMFTVSFFREALANFRDWIDELLVSSWKACQECDLLIESPSAMGGIHIAEALKIPYFRAFTMPWTRTRAYPHAFAVPSQKMGGNYNTISYVMFDNVFWQATAGQINRWRSKELGLPSTSLDKLQVSKVPFLYNFSPSVVAPPLDFNHWIRVTGYWFLDEGVGYQPPKELARFIRKAREDRKKIVYVGFGSIVVEDPAALTATVVDSVLKADVRCILSKGWSERLGKSDPSATELSLPDAIHQIKSAPHDWLFKQIDAAAHHGGAGTTGASLRAGIPTIVKPFFGDQFFFGSRVEDLGVGRCLKKINTSVFARALWEATNSERMIVKARLLGEQIRSEDGVSTAIQAIYRDLEYAKSLIKRQERAHGEGNIEEPEESWTLVDESVTDLARQSTELDQSSEQRDSSDESSQSD